MNKKLSETESYYYMAYYYPEKKEIFTLHKKVQEKLDEVLSVVDSTEVETIRGVFENLGHVIINDDMHNQFKTLINYEWKLFKGYYFNKLGYSMTSKCNNLACLDYKNIDGYKYNVAQVVYTLFNNLDYFDVVGVKLKIPQLGIMFGNIIEDKVMVDVNLNEIDNIDKSHYLYLAKIKCKQTGEVFCKVGVTSQDVEKRFEKNKNIEIIDYRWVYFIDGVQARGYESIILERIIPYEHKTHPNCMYNNGANECYKHYMFDTINDILNKISNKFGH